MYHITYFDQEIFHFYSNGGNIVFYFTWYVTEKKKNHQSENKLSLSRVDFHFFYLGLLSQPRLWKLFESVIHCLLHSSYGNVNNTTYLACKLHAQYEIDSQWHCWNVIRFLITCRSWKMPAEDEINMAERLLMDSLLNICSNGLN